jgi:hypothetical protein
MPAAATDGPWSGGPAGGNPRRVRPRHLVPGDVLVHTSSPSRLGRQD